MSNDTRTKLLMSLLLVLCAVLAYISILTVQYKREVAMRTLALQGSFERENNYGTALFFLAGERFANHDKKGETWIFSTHDPAHPLQKLTDGRFVLVSIPTNDFTGVGFELYASHYNDWVVEKADSLALRGDFGNALTIYELVLQYDKAGLKVDRLKKKIALVEQLKEGQNIEANKSALSGLIGTDRLVPSYFEGVETISAIKVTNLFAFPN